MVAVGEPCTLLLPLGANVVLLLARIVVQLAGKAVSCPLVSG